MTAQLFTPARSPQMLCNAQEMVTPAQRWP
jgi:hypothetical protein